MKQYDEAIQEAALFGGQKREQFKRRPFTLEFKTEVIRHT
jgi:hypothetical protein